MDLTLSKAVIFFSFIISVKIPSIAHQNAKISTLPQLKERINRYGIPHGWVITSEHSLTKEVFFVRIVEDDSLLKLTSLWTIKFHGRDVPTKDVHSRINNYQMLKTILSKIKLYHPCSGVPQDT